MGYRPVAFSRGYELPTCREAGLTFTYNNTGLWSFEPQTHFSGKRKGAQTERLDYNFNL